MKGVFAHSDEADKMFMDYLNKVKKGIPPASRKRSLSSSTSSSSKKPRT